MGHPVTYMGYDLSEYPVSLQFAGGDPRIFSGIIPYVE